MAKTIGLIVKEVVIDLVNLAQDSQSEEDSVSSSDETIESVNKTVIKSEPVKKAKKSTK